MNATLFDTPVKEKNTEDRILEYLMRGNSLTTIEAQRLFHTTELRTYIARLINKRHYNIVGTWIRVEVCGHETQVKRFKIADSF